MSDLNIKDNPFKAAVANIQARAERQDDESSLLTVYVDYGLLDRLQANKNEIIVGRRGTGKTQLLKAFIQKASFPNRQRGLFYYIDCNKFDSGRLDLKISAETQANLILNRLFSEIKGFLLLKASTLELPDRGREGRILDELSKFDRMSSDFIKNINNVSAADVLGLLESTLDHLQCDLLTIILDEWVGISERVQPLVAEKIRRAFFSSRRICFKIASIEYRSLMRAEYQGRHIGFEKGADIFCDIDLDGYLVYDINKEHVEQIFAEILYNHIFIHFPDKEKVMSLSQEQKIDFVRKNLFTTRDALIELVRAGEGVVRDFLQIFTQSYFDHFLLDKTQNRISVSHVRKGAGDWFQKDKINVTMGNENLSKCLTAIISEIIGNKKARSFLVKQEDSNHETLQALFDARLLHLVRRGWSHKGNPGQRYDIFTIDYGTYVEKINTTSGPQIELFGDLSRIEDAEHVPFDDKRSIRRIVLPDGFLNKYVAKD